MNYKSFRVKNFKGIDEVSLDIKKPPLGPIVTLVGLNESGKTTVLEAISYLESDDEHVEFLVEEVYPQSDVNDFVPLKKKANFNGTTEISCEVEISESDKDDIVAFAKSIDVTLNRDRLGHSFRMEKVFNFENSIYKTTKNLWTVALYGTVGKGRKEVAILSKDRDKWLEIIYFIRSRLPAILFFPTFLFEFPSRIYLNYGEGEESVTNSYYRSVIQDVLDSLEDDLSIQEHIVERAIDGGSFKKRSLVSVLNKMGNAVSKTVFERWNEIFDRKIPRKDININFDIEETDAEGGLPKVYLEFEIKEGDSIYLLSERSLGFRWFFCFLLFTQYRAMRRANRNVLFLMDEPASNLHSKAQTQLLESFSKIVGRGSAIIYSTHSPYMIKPDWLENSYIVRNDGLRYDDPVGDYEYSSRETNIKIERYRDFVGKNPEKDTYFQPILDALDYVPCGLEYIPDAVFVEGKNDYYMIKYFEKLLDAKNDFSIVPGIGSGGMDSLISLYLGWGKKFMVMLDGDAAGRREAERYEKEWFLDSSKVVTLAEVNDDWRGMAIDGLIVEQDRKLILSEIASGKKRIGKKELCRFIQEKVLKEDYDFSFSEKTLKNFSDLFSYINDSRGGW